MACASSYASRAASCSVARMKPDFTFHSGRRSRAATERCGGRHGSAEPPISTKIGWVCTLRQDPQRKPGRALQRHVERDRLLGAVRHQLLRRHHDTVHHDLEQQQLGTCRSAPARDASPPARCTPAGRRWRWRRLLGQPGRDSRADPHRAGRVEAVLTADVTVDGQVEHVTATVTEVRRILTQTGDPGFDRLWPRRRLGQSHVRAPDPRALVVDARDSRSHRASGCGTRR